MLNGVSLVTAWPEQCAGQVWIGSETTHDNFNFGATRFERQGKFLNFYEVYEYFRKIFLFLSHVLIFHLKIFFL